MAPIRGRDRRNMWERDRARREMTRGKVTARPHSVRLSLKEKRWNTHTDLPSVNRVCKRENERREGSQGQRRQGSESRLCFRPISFGSSSRSRHPCPVHHIARDVDCEQGNWINCPTFSLFFFFFAMRAETAWKQSSCSPLLSPSGML